MCTMYQAVISQKLNTDLLHYYNSVCTGLPFINGPNFPARRRLNELHPPLIAQLFTEIKHYVGLAFQVFEPNMAYIRFYESYYGVIKPHKDVAVHPQDTHTCLIYLTDDFVGGALTVESANGIRTFQPKQTFGVFFAKGVTHYTNELIEGRKVILLIDCKIVEKKSQLYGICLAGYKFLMDKYLELLCQKTTDEGKRLLMELWGPVLKTRANEVQYYNIIEQHHKVILRTADTLIIDLTITSWV